ncbi:nudC domain-containing protein 1-like isoform X2 [Mizuhopecten yessoensis]|uniref:NudC domain-containing protein 1 n=1 Tax=Mizuhopecten yessoensis TaxID=6573 RepID=A0A210QJC2_MIZYE|nr:nudC domain-containing protein 1-like isoform X2 [Mizuhopecten yessoensis]OWF48809.1 NudC domain-containing protein 1 [Mizuhopecten yessoensis]
MADTVELKICRELLDPKFDGYKLSLDKLPLYKSQLDNAIEVVSLGDDQFSFHHAKIYGVHNHLFLDLWSEHTCSVYIIDTDWAVVRSTSMGMTLDTGRKVLQIPDATNQKLTPRRLNLVLQFISPDMAVISDGAGKFHLVDTGNRGDDSSNWKIIFSKDLIDNGEPFVLADAVTHTVDETHYVECLCVHVEESTEEQKDRYRSPYLTMLKWITLTSVDRRSWSVERTRQLIGRKPYDYAAFDHTGSSVIISAAAEFKFVYDSSKPIQEEAAQEPGNGQNGKPAPEYTWHQDSDEICAMFTVPEGVKKEDIYLTLKSEYIDFGIKNVKALLKGQLHRRIDVDASTWTIIGQRIELTLGKPQLEAWPVIVQGDERGEMTVDEGLVAQIHERLAHLTSDDMNPSPELMEGQPYNAQQLEDCDAFPDDSSLLHRIDGNTHRTVSQTNLGSHQWLFNARVCRDQPPALCLRHDVDGLLWQPENVVKEQMTPWKHISTFNAFGYVQASKQQRKYTTCPPGSLYVAVCDCVRHVYVYRQPTPITSPVRNRKTGQKVNAVAKQQLVSLESVDNILGIQATDEKLFMITRNMVYVANVNMSP